MNGPYSRWMAALSGGMILMALSAASAGEVDAAMQPAADKAVEEPASAPPSKYWIGLACTKLADPQRQELGVDGEVQGIVVLHVVPDGPAQKAGVKENDVLTAAGDKKLVEVTDLIEAVEAAGDDNLELKVVRGDEQLTFTVRPAKRPSDAQPWMAPPGVGAAEWEKLERWLRQMEPGEASPRLRFRFLHPGAVLPPGAAGLPLPDDMTVVITKHGKDPATIVVEQGNERWEVREDELDKLPEAVRTHVERMLGRNLWAFGEQDFQLMVPKVAPQPPLKPAPKMRPKTEPKPAPSVDERLDQIERRLDDLLEKIDRSGGKDGQPEGSNR